MVTPYVRPESSSYPQTYYRFEASDPNSNNIVKYHVQDLTEDDYDKALELIAKYLTPDETFQRAINLAGKDYLTELLQLYFGSIFDEKVSIACFNSESNEMVGLNALTIKSRGVKETLQVKNKSCLHSNIFQALILA